MKLQPVNVTKIAWQLMLFGSFTLVSSVGCSTVPGHEQPEDAAALASRGLIRAEQGDERGAIADFTDSLRLKPANDEALYLRGAARDRLGDRAGALADYDEALRRNANLLPALVARAALLTALGNHGAAAVDEATVQRLAGQDQQLGRVQ